MQRRIGILVLLLIFYGWGRSCIAASTEGNTADPFAILFQMPDRYREIDNYTAILISQERVEGELQPESVSFLKFKKPFMLYMKWLEGPKEGREVLYVEGKYDNKLVVSSQKWYDIFVRSLDPHGTLAMRGNRHPITDAGIGQLIEILTTNFRLAQEKGEIKIRQFSSDTMFGRPTYQLEATFPPNKYYASRVMVHIDQQYLLPIYVSVFDEANQLIERYGYKDLRLNVGLTEKDFDKSNEEYNF